MIPVSLTPVMKKLLVSSICAVMALGLSSCCCLFGGTKTYTASQSNVGKMASGQASIGSPHIGLVPTMKPLAP